MSLSAKAKAKATGWQRSQAALLPRSRRSTRYKSLRGHCSPDPIHRNIMFNPTPIYRGRVAAFKDKAATREHVCDGDIGCSDESELR